MLSLVDSPLIKKLTRLNDADVIEKPKQKSKVINESEKPEQLAKSKSEKLYRHKKYSDELIKSTVIEMPSWASAQVQTQEEIEVIIKPLIHNSVNKYNQQEIKHRAEEVKNI